MEGSRCKEAQPLGWAAAAQGSGGPVVLLGPLALAAGWQRALQAFVQTLRKGLVPAGRQQQQQQQQCRLGPSCRACAGSHCGTFNRTAVAAWRMWRFGRCAQQTCAQHAAICVQRPPQYGAAAAAFLTALPHALWKDKRPHPRRHHPVFGLQASASTSTLTWASSMTPPLASTVRVLRFSPAGNLVSLGPGCSCCVACVKRQPIQPAATLLPACAAAAADGRMPVAVWQSSLEWQRTLVV